MNRKETTVQPAAFVYLLVSLGLIFVLPVVSAAVEVGEKAPDFELRSTMGNTIRLSDFAGKKNVLIEFYVLDFAPGCTKAHETRRDAYEKFKAMDTEILGISIFSSYAQLAFAKTLALPYPLLSDFPSLETIKKFDVENQIGKITTAKRSYFIVDKSGIVRFKRIMYPIKPEASFLPNEVLFDALQRIKNSQ